MLNARTSSTERKNPRLFRSPRLWLPLLMSFALALSLFAISGYTLAPSPQLVERPDSSTTKIAPHQDSPRVISAFSERLIVRASGGTCSRPSTFEVSGDNGKSWLQIDISERADLSSVLALSVERPGYMSAIGYHYKTCDTIKTSSNNGGTYWADATQTGLSYFDANENSFYVLDDEDLELPCEAQGATHNNDIVAAICPSDELFISEPGGETWSNAITIPGLRAITSSHEGFIVITQNSSECAGLAAMTVSSGGSVTPGSCASIPTVDANVNIAATAVQDTLFVWAGEEFLTSSDLGSSWN